jgi:hypothetical protein
VDALLEMDGASIVEKLSTNIAEVVLKEQGYSPDV